MRLEKTFRTSLQFLILVVIGAVCINCQNGMQSPCIQQQEVSAAEAQLALDNALVKQGCDYEWGGNGPVVFDCSGLIVWAYWQSLGRRDIYFDGSYVVSDVSMQSLYDYNVRRISAEQVIPGDLIFITYDKGFISHGGLVVGVDDTSVQFINASSHFDEVVLDEWKKSETVRGQWIEAFGRLKICVQ
ncbi:MAG TPA: NlpC/P60 family protein [Clostridia bacterium]|nr:NlpC/P60 family protein [Clostridia bacterium]